MQQSPPPWPGDAETVTAWIRAAFRFLARGTDLERLAEQARITVAVDGNDVTACHIDLDGIDIPLDALRQFEAQDDGHDAAAPPAWPGEVDASAARQRVDGVVRDLLVTADPVRNDGFPARLHLQLDEIPVTWLVFDEPQVADEPLTDRALDPRELEAPLRGTASASIRQDDVTALVRRFIELETASLPVKVTLTDLTFSVAEVAEVAEVAGSATPEPSAGPTFDAALRASLRWGIIRMGGHASVRFTLTDAGVVTVHAADVSSKNPLIAFLLNKYLVDLDEIIGATFDLNHELADELGDEFGAQPLRLANVRLRADDTLEISADFV